MKGLQIRTARSISIAFMMNSRTFFHVQIRDVFLVVKETFSWKVSRIQDPGLLHAQMDLMLIFHFSGHLVYGLTKVLRSIAQGKAQGKEAFWASGEDETLRAIWTISFDPVSSKLCLLYVLQEDMWNMRMMFLTPTSPRALDSLPIARTYHRT